MDDKKLRVIGFRPEDCGGEVIVSLDDQGFAVLQEQIREGEIGESWIVTMREMTEKEFSELPEHEGW